MNKTTIPHFFIRLLLGLLFVIPILPLSEAWGATFTIQTGYYVGDGADNRTITGIGFQPNMVLIKDDTNGGTAGTVFKTSSMSGENCLAISETDAALATDYIQSLDADGFTIGTNTDVNAANVGFYWIAIGGSDCSASGTFCVGSYTGNGGGSQAIASVGFQPDLVGIKHNGTSLGVWKSSSMGGTNTNYFSGTAQLAANGISSLDATGFTVGNNAVVNTNTATYYYFAFKQVSGAMDVGTYTGDGVDSRNITSANDAGLTFQPNFAWVKPTTAVVAVASISENYGDRSFLFDDNASAANHIQALRSAGGFQVGTSTSSNTNTNTLYYAAFGGATTKAAGTGDYQQASGTYTGNGTSQSVTGLGFTPNLVIVKNTAAQQSIFKTTTMIGDRSAYFANAATVFTGGITSIDADGFSVGAGATANSNAATYYWTAFGNAMRQDKSGGSSNFMVGQYIASGTDSTDVNRLPIAPNLVMVKRVGATAGVWRTSNQSGDQSIFFAATALAADHIQALNSDGFQKGANASVNTSANTYDFFAFKSGTKFVTGTYTGTGSSQGITSPGFQPEYLWIKKTTGGSAREGVMRNSSQTGDAALPFGATASQSNGITSLNSGGFTVNTLNLANENTFTYQYAAWDTKQYGQAAYRLYQNTNTTDVGSTLAALNTSYSFPASNSTFRLRMLLSIDYGNLYSSNGTFKLQFVDKGAGTCASPSGTTPASYTDVAVTTGVGYNDNSTPTDDTVLTVNANDPTDGGRTLVTQTYEESNNFSNSQGAIVNGRDGKWDFSLMDNGASSSRTYCFRAVTSAGTVLSAYTQSPEISVPADVTAPTISITTSESDPTYLDPFPITIQFSEKVTGFAVGDLVVGNGSAGNFVAVDADTYTADITRTVFGHVTVDIAGSVAQDIAGNNNTAATQFTIYSTGRRRVIRSD